MDDLSDLTWSDTAAPATRPAGKSAFDYLSSGGHYTPSYTPPLRPGSAAGVSVRPPVVANSHKPAGPPLKDGGDVFSSLFDSNPSRTTARDASKMSMAERLAAQRSEGIRGPNGATDSTLAMPIPGDFGNIGLGCGSSAPFGNGSKPASPPPAVLTRTSSAPWDFDALPSVSGSSPGTTPAPAPATSKLGGNGHARNDSWGISFDGMLTPSSSADNQGSNNKAREHSTSLLGDYIDDDTPGPSQDSDIRDPLDGGVSLKGDDDILGVLGQPIDEVAIRRQAEAILSEADRTSSRRPEATGSVSTDRASPPPHILGQVVEMGFGIAQARLALLRTRERAGQWSVEAAVGSLVGGDGPSEPVEDQQPGQRARHNRVEDGVISPHPSRRRPAVAPVPPERQDSTTTIPREYQEQAAVLLAQASAYGNSALGRASAFWKQGKASLAKALEEREANSKARGEAGSTRPKWMRDTEQEAEAEPGNSRHLRSIGKEADFKDDGDMQGALSPLPQERAQPTGPDPAQPRPPSPNLLGTPAPSLPHANPPSPGSRQPYVSSARRRVAERTTRVPSQRTATQPVGHLAAAESRRPPRQLPSPSAAQSSTSARHKSRGNESFKRGQFGEAESAYTAALDSLPEGCWERVVIWNNRAMARLKNGDGRGAGEDATLAISLICATPTNTSTIHPAMSKLDLGGLDVDAKTVPPGSGINLREQLGKALSRRARAAEAREKWAEAAQDWETARGAGEIVVRSAGGAKPVSDGVARCRKLANGGNTKPHDGATRSSVAAKRPVPPPARPPLSPNKPSAAVTALRNANEAAEAEALERLAVKDGVDARLLAWKGGKEANLRALIASLENVLWDGLGWKKVGMGELLSDAQVKSKYVRAISKLHPDKIPKDATVEQQMIAKGVFATLNEAWIATQ